MQKKIRTLLRLWDFRRQLTLVFIVGVIVLALVTSAVVSRISTNFVRTQLLDQGSHITSAFARLSYLSLLYNSVENADEAVASTLGFENIVAVAIYRPDGSMLVEGGEVEVLKILPMPDFNGYSEAVLTGENDEYWQFTAPVFSGSDEESPFEVESVDQVLEGGVVVIMSQRALTEMAGNILWGNVLVSLGVALLILLLLLALSERVTKPLQQLSKIMRRAEHGEKKLRADIRGPKDIIDMQHAFNTMMAVLERRELELLQAKDAAVESARVKGEFAANVSHELRTPMNAVLGMLDLLMTMGLSQKQAEYVETAKSSGEVLLDLIDDVLNFSKVESGVIDVEREDTYIEDLLDEVVGLMSSHALKRKIDLGYVCANTVPQLISVDAARIRQVLINLVGNAIKFTEQGEVSVRLMSQPSAGGGVMLKFEVRDSGIGISPEAQERIFDAFTQADSSTTRKYGGTGLGLAISRRIVEMMGGEISLVSALGKGSTFCFTVPLADSEIIAKPNLPQKIPAELKQLRVLSVDSSDIVHDFLESHFELWGVSGTALKNGLLALDRLRDSVAEDRQFQVVILDEDIAGLKAADLIKLINNEPFADKLHIVVLVSPWNECKNLYPEQIVQVTKPLRSGTLYEILRQVTGGSVDQSAPQPDRTAVLSRLAKRVLVADDNRANQQVAVGMLERLGCEVSVVDSGEEALNQLFRNSFDLVLMDCQMPVMDGYEATGRIRKYEGEEANVPVIAMTANNSSGERQRCREAGMDDFLPKPLRLDQLQKKLQLWFADELNQQPVTPPGSVAEPSGEWVTTFDPQVIIDLRASVGEVVDSMIEAFIEDTPVYLQSLKHAAAQRDAKQIHELAHTVKGSASNFGALEVVTLSKELEDLGRSGEVDNAGDKLPALITAFSALRKDLEQEISYQQTSYPAAGDGVQYSVLIADDDRAMRMALRNSLEADGYIIEEAQNGSHALSICQRKVPDLILMDALMPEVDGFQACEQIRQLPNGADLPILMITALDDEESIVKAFGAGASDYIPKPVHFSVMRQRVSRLLQASRTEQHVKKLAYHDPLTGLPNRAQLMQQLRLMVNRAALNDEMVAVLFLDLDRFKMINDSLGHDAGDLLLKAVADRIRRCLREQDFVARLGGDEFTVVLEGINTPDVAAKVAQKICESLGEPFVFLQQKMFVTTSVGISLYPSDGGDVGTLLKHADSAMFGAKDKGNSYRFYEHGMEDDISHRLELERELRVALENDELVLHYQPQLDAKTGAIVSAEALVRWQHPRHGLMLPGKFVPLAEESDLINDLGHWVMREACRQLREWVDIGCPLRMAVNFSGREIQADGLVERLSGLIAEYRVPPELLELEITESMLLKHHDRIIDDLTRIKQMGITLAIDDFGSGYSSLNYLKHLPVDVLKIDRTFVSDLDGDEDGQAIVGGIIALADNLGLGTVAEGVETAEQQQLLADLGCQLLQGFLFSPGVPADEFAACYLLAAEPTE